MSVDGHIREMVAEAMHEELDRWKRELSGLLAELRRGQGINGGAGSGIPELVSVADAAKRLGVHTNTVRGLIRDGELTCYQVGRLHRIRVDELLNYLRRAEPSRDKVVDLEARARELLARR